MENNMYLLFQNIQKLTRLEYLEIRYAVSVSFQQLLDLCSCLSNLKYLLFTNAFFESYGDLEYHELFVACSSLHVVIYKNATVPPKNSMIFAKCFRDITTNTIMKLPHISQEPQSQSMNSNSFNTSTDLIYEGIPARSTRLVRINIKDFIYEGIPQKYRTIDNENDVDLVSVNNT